MGPLSTPPHTQRDRRIYTIRERWVHCQVNTDGQMGPVCCGHVVDLPKESEWVVWFWSGGGKQNSNNNKYLTSNSVTGWTAFCFVFIFARGESFLAALPFAFVPDFPLPGNLLSLGSYEKKVERERTIFVFCFRPCVYFVMSVFQEAHFLYGCMCEGKSLFQSVNLFMLIYIPLHAFPCHFSSCQRADYVVCCILHPVFIRYAFVSIR